MIGEWVNERRNKWLILSSIVNKENNNNDEDDDNKNDHNNGQALSISSSKTDGAYPTSYSEEKNKQTPFLSSGFPK